MKHSLHEICPNTEFFLVRIFNADQTKLLIWTCFTQWFYKSNSRWLDVFLDTEESQSQVWCYQNSSWSIWDACTKIILKGLYSWCLSASMHQKDTKQTRWQKLSLHCRSLIFKQMFPLIYRNVIKCHPFLNNFSLTILLMGGG